MFCIMNIQFIPSSKFAEENLSPPLPAKKVLPEWYKKTPFLIKGNNEYELCGDNVNATLKSCNPFLDSLTSGYVICLSTDLQITKKKNTISYDNENNNKIIEFNWRTENTVITPQSKEQYPLLPSPFNGNNSVFKFHNDFIIKTPRGYSTHFFHPANQHDLPFRLLSGIVDTDTYSLPLNFPFQLLDLSERVTTLKKGTPICQFVPFKRDTWSHKVEKYDKKLIEKEMFNYLSRIYRAYKSLHWVKKKFD